MDELPPGDSATTRPTLPLLIVGASARAAAQAARRVGYVPLAVDAFGDVDTAHCCEQSVRVANYPHDILDACRRFPAAPWMYTGALENHPRLIDELSEARPLWGNSGAVLRRVRDPATLFAALARAGFDCLPWQLTPAGLPTDGAWLQKRLKSAGGLHVTVWSDDSADRADDYYQRRAAGRVLGAAFVGNGADATLLGVTEHLPATAGNCARPFVYAGSFGPVTLAQPQLDQLARLGQCLAGEFGLLGLFGVDLIDDGQQLWPLEVNPRYTASLEILDRTLGISTISLHAQACVERRLPAPRSHAANIFAAKAIIYASRATTIDEQFSTWAKTLNSTAVWPIVADIPAAGSEVAANSPLCTILTSAPTRDSALAKLKALVQPILYLRTRVGP